MVNKLNISKLWREIEECGCKISIKEVEKLFTLGIKNLSELKANKERRKDFGIAEENCLEKILK